MFSFLLDNLTVLLVGYAIAVLFPMPWLSQAIINGWAKILPWVKSKVSSQ